MDALRELIEVTDRTLTIRLPDHFQAMRVEVIVLDANDATRVRSGAALTRRRPSPLMAGARMVGDIMSPVVDPDDWGVLT